MSRIEINVRMIFFINRISTAEDFAFEMIRLLMELVSG